MSRQIDHDAALAAWESFISGGLPSSAVTQSIVRSWRRSKKAGVDPETPHFHRISNSDLARRIAANRAFVDAAIRHIDWLSESLSAMAHVAYIADREGIVLHSKGSDEETLSQFGLLPGYDWSENRMGTSGVGAAIVSKRPVSVLGCEHYCRVWHTSSCIAAPVWSPDGRIIGGIDVSVPADKATPELLVMVTYAARAIGADLQASEKAAEAWFDHLGPELLFQRSTIERVSDDLRSPVAGIILKANVVERKSEQRDWDAVKRQAADIVGLGYRVDRLVAALTDYSQIRAGTLVLEPVETSVNDLIDEIRLTLEPFAAEKGLSLDVGSAPSGSTLFCDGERIVQALLDLVGVAIESAPQEGRVGLRCEREAGGFAFQATVNGDGLATGSVTEAMEVGIFERNEGNGLGLELYVARAIVDLHRGSIEVKSEPGNTAVITVRLPS